MTRVNLSPARLAVLVALVVGGIAVMINGFGDEGTAVAGGGSDVVEPTSSDTVEPTGSASPTETQSPAVELEPQVDGVMIQVLNGTEAAGLAAQVDLFLVAKGYDSASPPADAAQQGVPDTIVYFRTGDDAEQNEVDAANLAKKYLKGVDATVKPLNASLDADVAPKTQIVVVLGQDYADANPVV
jgi:hypothetical protein